MKLRFGVSKRRRKALRWALLAGQAVLLGLTLFVSVKSGHSPDPADTACASLDLLGMTVLGIIFFSIHQNRTGEKADQMLTVGMSILSLDLYAEVCMRLFNGQPGHWGITWTAAFVHTLCSLSLGVNSWHYLRVAAGGNLQQRDRWIRAIHDFAVAGVALLLIGAPFGFFFRVSPETGECILIGPMLYMILPAVIQALGIYWTLRQTISPGEKAVLISILCLPMIFSVVSSAFLQLPLSTMGFFCSMVFVYTTLYQKRSDELMVRRHDLVKSQLMALRLQINPHFIYNTLGSIAGLCEVDPETAEKLIAEFSSYLRDNLSEDGDNPMIPLEEELENIEHYVYIEKIRFPRIKVNYDLKALDFKMPAMTLQPIVENAIHHGVCKRKWADGLIVISSKETATDYVVSVIDNGVGFRQEDLEDGRKHIGIENVRTRLRLICGGSMEIRSIPGYGTTCELFIPKGLEEKEGIK